MCQRTTGEKSSGVSPSQRRMGAGAGHARPLPVSVGNLRATACLAKRDSKTGRDRKGGIESEWRVNASLWRKDVPGYRQNTAESRLTKKASMTHGWRLDVCSDVTDTLKNTSRHSLSAYNTDCLVTIHNHPAEDRVFP